MYDQGFGTKQYYRKAVWTDPKSNLNIFHFILAKALSENGVRILRKILPEQSSTENLRLDLDSTLLDLRCTFTYSTQKPQGSTSNVKGTTNSKLG